MKKSFSRLMICLTAAISFPAAAQSAPAPNPLRGSLYGLAEQFEWKEFDDDGGRILKESGPLFGVGGRVDFDTGKGVHVEGLAEGFFGRVDYDGATQSGVPVSSRTKYAGATAEATLALPLKMGPGLSAGPFGGAGGRLWRRDLEDSGDSYGYVENWTTLYGIAGFRAAGRMGSNAELYGKAAVKLPFYNRVNYDFSRLNGPDDVEVEPDGKASPFLEVGITVGDFLLAGFYEEMHFEKSNQAEIGNSIIVWQPESEAAMFGVRAGVTF